MNDLKPCPFCGGEATAHTWEYTSGPQLFAGVFCVGCGALCETEVFADKYSASALAKMIAAWNRRYPSTALIRARTALERIASYPAGHPSYPQAVADLANDALTEIKKIGGRE